MPNLNYLMSKYYVTFADFHMQHIRKYKSINDNPEVSRFQYKSINSIVGNFVDNQSMGQRYG